jgi:hypothetical protein
LSSFAASKGFESSGTCEELRVQNVAADEHEPVQHVPVSLADAVVEGETAAVGHLHVAHHQVVVALFEELRSHLPVDRQVHCESAPSQQPPQQ